MYISNYQTAAAFQFTSATISAQSVEADNTTGTSSASASYWQASITLVEFSGYQLSNQQIAAVTAEEEPDTKWGWAISSAMQARVEERSAAIAEMKEYRPEVPDLADRYRITDKAGAAEPTAAAQPETAKTDSSKVENAGQQGASASVEFVTATYSAFIFSATVSSVSRAV